LSARKQYEDMWLSREDLQRLRDARTMSEVAQSGNPAISPDDAQRFLIEDVAMLEYLREKYDIPPDESVGFSLIDGMILDLDEEL
jgi:hypothetical protein